MTKQEVTALLAILSEFYRDRSTDPMQTVNAWYVILKDYDYLTAERAVFEFVKHDMRDYASFPAVGVIIGAIEKEIGTRRYIFNQAFHKIPFEALDEDCKSRVSEKVYGRMLELSEDELTDKKDIILRTLTPQKSQLMIEG